MVLPSRFLMGFPLPLPDARRERGKRKRKFGRTSLTKRCAGRRGHQGPVLAGARHALRKDAAARGSARLRASLDRRGDRRSVRLQAGTEKRRSNRTEKREGRRGLISRDASRVQWMATAVDITTWQRHKLLIFRALSGPSNILG